MLCPKTGGGWHVVLSVEFPKYSILGSRPLTGYTVANFSLDHGKEGFELGEEVPEKGLKVRPCWLFKYTPWKLSRLTWKSDTFWFLVRRTILQQRQQRKETGGGEYPRIYTQTSHKNTKIYIPRSTISTSRTFNNTNMAVIGFASIIENPSRKKGNFHHRGPGTEVEREGGNNWGFHVPLGECVSTGNFSFRV